MINARLEIGDRVRLPVEPTGKEFLGEVIYIHPKRWFFRAEFVTELGDRIHAGDRPLRAELAQEGVADALQRGPGQA